MSARRAAAVLLLLCGLEIACDHSAPFATPGTPMLGPFTNGLDIQLTYSNDEDYWPVLTQDGSGVLYAFVDSSQSDLRAYGHRCMGLLPIAGGTRRWQWCDNSAALFDSLSGFSGYALGSDGRLLYVESTSNRVLSFILGETTIWLADTTHPFRRRALLTLPTMVGDSAVSWLSDLQWTGPTPFIGLAQHYLPATHCEALPLKACGGGLDSIFNGGILIRGTIGAASASLQAVAGTAGATGYSLAEGGASIVFVTRNSAQLFKVPAAGGVPVAVATVTTAPGVQLFGVSCQGTSCVVGLGPVTIWAPVIPGPGNDYTNITPGVSEIRLVSLTMGTSVQLVGVMTADSHGNLVPTAGIFSSPLIVSASGDVIAQFGKVFGHLQTSSTTDANLHLFPGLLYHPIGMGLTVQ